MPTVRREEPRPVRDWVATVVTRLRRRRPEDLERALERQTRKHSGVEDTRSDREADFRVRNSQGFRN